jgi:hypothetical protein
MQKEAEKVIFALVCSVSGVDEIPEVKLEMQPTHDAKYPVRKEPNRLRAGLLLERIVVGDRLPKKASLSTSEFIFDDFKKLELCRARPRPMR